MMLLAALVALLVLGLAARAITAPGAFASVTAFIAYGLVLTLAWTLLHGVDVALTEAAIGGGLTGALLIGAWHRLGGAAHRTHDAPPSAATRTFAAILAASVSGVLAACVLVLPSPAPTLAPQAMQAIGPTGVGNPVTAVLLAYRAMDTLLEAIVLLFALIGVGSLAAGVAYEGRPGRRAPYAAASPLTFIARELPPVGILVGLYLFWVGADLPGGKFQAATIVAAMALLVQMAGLADVPPLRSAVVRIGLVVGPAVFLAVGFLGAWQAGAFLAYPDGYAKPLIIAIEAALMPSLVLVLALLLYGTPDRSDAEAAR